MTEYGEVKVNVDTVLLTLKDGHLHAALAPRGADYQNGRLALIGGIMDGNKDKNLDAVVERTLADKAGLSGVYYEQLYTFSGRSRDDRWPSITVAYIALVTIDKIEHGKDNIALYRVEKLPKLPFDHNAIIDTAVSRLRGKGAWSVLPAHLLSESFTFTDLHEVYSQVLGKKIDRTSFRRKVLELGMLESLGRHSVVKGYRPVETFRIAKGISTVDHKF